MQYDSVFKNCALFKGIEVSDYAFLMSCINSYTKFYQPNEYIFFAGDVLNYVGIVLSGSVEVSKENQAGARHILSFLGPSSLFGEGIVCTEERISPVTVRVKDPATLLFIPYERIITTCGNSCGFHVKLIENMMMILGEKNMMLNHKLELLMLKGMREKLAAYLLHESHRQNNLMFRIIPNRNELAEYLNVSRTSMCRELARMKDEGIIDYYQNSFKILSLESLKQTGATKPL